MLGEWRAVLIAHHGLKHDLDRLETSAELARIVADDDLAQLMLRAVGSLERSRLPHVAWEEAVWFPATDQRRGADWLPDCLRTSPRSFSAGSS